MKRDYRYSLTCLFQNQDLIVISIQALKNLGQVQMLQRRYLSSMVTSKEPSSHGIYVVFSHFFSTSPFCQHHQSIIPQHILTKSRFLQDIPSLIHNTISRLSHVNDSLIYDSSCSVFVMSYMTSV